MNELCFIPIATLNAEIFSITRINHMCLPYTIIRTDVNYICCPFDIQIINLEITFILSVYYSLADIND